MADDRSQLDALLARTEAALAALLRPFLATIARAVRRAGEQPTGAVPAARSFLLSQLVAEGIAAIFGATPHHTIASDGTPLVPFAALLATATREATALVTAPAVAEVTARLVGQPDLLAALTGGRALPVGARPVTLLDTARGWVDPNGYRLSDRIWRNGQDVRAAIDTILDAGIRAGTTATDLARALDGFLTPEGAALRTRTPYGSTGLYAPRRLARTEITRAHGAATVEMARLNPFAAGVKWNLSGSHPAADECDQHAARDAHGLGAGIYPADALPTYPDHPHCLCYLTTHLRRDAASVVADLGRWARGEAVAGFETTGSVPLESVALVDWLTGFPAPERVQ